jgi:hypothetical protein
MSSFQQLQPRCQTSKSSKGRQRPQTSVAEMAQSQHPKIAGQMLDRNAERFRVDDIQIRPPRDIPTLRRVASMLISANERHNSDRANETANIPAAEKYSRSGRRGMSSAGAHLGDPAVESRLSTLNTNAFDLTYRVNGGWPAPFDRSTLLKGRHSTGKR